MSTKTNNCPTCGTPLPSDAPKGLCPECLLHGGFESAGAPEMTQRADDPREHTIHIVLPVDEPPVGVPETIRYFGDYELLEQLAVGGMGVVFKARQLSLNRLVAVKMIRSGQLASEADIRRFRNEAEAAANLKHPHIVAIHEVGEHQGRHFFSMDFIEGRSLAEIVRDRPLEPARAARLVQTVAEAIAYAHQRGVLHRDLKPSNVMIDAQDEPHVTDFGLAKLLKSDSELTQTGAVMGSPSYMSPEQARGLGDQVSARSDVYALGAILYELLTGHPPFRAATPLETMKLVAEREPVAPRAVNRTLPRDLETICLKCLQKAPARRYASAQDLADDLGRVLRDEPIRARPAGSIEKVWRWCRRKPALAAALVGLVAVFAAGVAGVLSQWKRAERSAVDAVQQTQLAEERLYAADVFRALRAWQDGDLGSTRVQIEAHKHQTNLHDFVWHYVAPRSQCDQHFRLPGHSDYVCQIVFSPDGRTLATRDRGRTLKIWNLSTVPVRDHEIGEAGHEQLTLTNVTGLGGFVQDGKTVVIALGNNRPVLCDAATGRIVQELPFSGRPFKILADGKTAAFTSAEYRLKLWNVETSAEGGVVAGDGSWIDHDPYLSCLDLTPDGRWLATAETAHRGVGFHGFVIWNVSTGKLRARLTSSLSCWSMALSPDGSKLAAGGMDGYARVWELNEFDTRSGAIDQATSATRIPLHEATMGPIVFFPDSVNLATSAADQVIKLASLNTQQPWQQYAGHANAIGALAISPDGRLVASGDRDGVVRLWRVEPPEDKDTFAPVRSEFASLICFSPDGKMLAVQGGDLQTRLLETSTLRIVETIPERLPPVGFSSDGRRLMLGKSSHMVWDIQQRQALSEVKFREVEAFHDPQALEEITAKRVSADGRLTAVALSDFRVLVYDNATGTEVANHAQHRDRVHSLAFSQNGNMLVSQDRTGLILFWDLANGKPLARLQAHREMLAAMDLSPDGRLLATGGRDRLVKLWDVGTRRLLHTLAGHRPEVTTLAFAPDGMTLATGDTEGVVKLWNLKINQEVGTLKLHARPALNQINRIKTLLFSPDSSVLAARSDGGLVKVWRTRLP